MVFSPSKLGGSVNTMSGTVSTTSSASAMSSCAPMESKTTQKRTITTDDKQIKAENSGTSFLASFFTDVRLHITNIHTRSSCASIMWMTVGTLDVDHRRCAMRMCIGRLETISCRYCHFCLSLHVLFPSPPPWCWHGKDLCTNNSGKKTRHPSAYNIFMRWLFLQMKWFQLSVHHFSRPVTKKHAYEAYELKNLSSKSLWEISLLNFYRWWPLIYCAKWIWCK